MDYKKLFKIQKSLLKNDIPDDLMPIIFEYLGDLNESVDELRNKHAFYKITGNYVARINWIGSTQIIDWKPYTPGHFCNVCQKFYLIHSPAQIRNHINNDYHKKQLKLNKYPIDYIDTSKLKKQYKIKDWRFKWESEYRKKKIIESLCWEKITFT